MQLVKKKYKSLSNDIQFYLCQQIKGTWQDIG